MTVSIPPYVPPYGPTPNITPFTYRDGYTYLQILEGLRKYVNDTLIPFINDNVGGLVDQVTEEINRMIETVNAALEAQDDSVDQKIAELVAYVDAAIASIINNSVTVQDPVVAALVNNPASATSVALNAHYTDISYEAVIDTGRLSDATLDAEYAPKSLETVVAGKADKTYVDTENAKQRPITPVTQAAGVDFNTLVTSGSFAFETAPTSINAPTNETGLLTVEASATQVEQTYFAYGTYVNEPEIYTRFKAGTSWAEWRAFRGNRGFRPRGKITFIGDSYMNGTGLSNPSTERWPTLLAAAFACTEQNLSNASSGYVNPGTAGDFVTQSLNTAADTNTVIICGGINDAPMNPTQGAITTAVNSIVTNIRAAAPNARIVFISPMWFQNDITFELTQIDKKVRFAVNAIGARYIDDAAYLRIDRDDLTFGDGHPNAAGSVVIKEWVYDQILNTPRPGAARGFFVSTLTGDPTITGPSITLIADGTISDARPGWWRINGQVIFYGATLGFLSLNANGFVDEMRDDITEATNPQLKFSELIYYHKGGDLSVGIGYRPNASATTTNTGLRKNRVNAEWMRI
jgi:lysophospholipase L1-like esterase